MEENKSTTNATSLPDSASIYEIMLTAQMLKYYQVCPKYVMQDFAVFFCREDMADELKLELEVILGITIKYEVKSDSEMSELLEIRDKREVHF